VFIKLLPLYVLACFGGIGHAQQGKNAAEASFHATHHLSVLLADTHIDGEGNNAAIGIDYEYRVSQLLGLGAAFERQVAR
jgi:hypothetical protein